MREAIPKSRNEYGDRKSDEHIKGPRLTRRHFLRAVGLLVAVSALTKNAFANTLPDSIRERTHKLDELKDKWEKEKVDIAHQYKRIYDLLNKHLFFTNGTFDNPNAEYKDAPIIFWDDNLEEVLNKFLDNLRSINMDFYSINLLLNKDARSSEEVLRYKEYIAHITNRIQNRLRAINGHFSRLINVIEDGLEKESRESYPLYLDEYLKVNKFVSKWVKSIEEGFPGKIAEHLEKVKRHLGLNEQYTKKDSRTKDTKEDF